MKSVFITGGAGGLAVATLELLVSKGLYVYAADLPGPALTALDGRANVTTVALDVTDAASIDAALERVGGSGAALDGLVNFAGILGVGSLVEIPEADIMRVLDINVMGTYRVNKAFLHAVRAGLCLDFRSIAFRSIALGRTGARIASAARHVANGRIGDLTSGPVSFPARTRELERIRR